MPALNPDAPSISIRVRLWILAKSARQRRPGWNMSSFSKAEPSAARQRRANRASRRDGDRLSRNRRRCISREGSQRREFRYSSFGGTLDKWSSPKFPPPGCLPFDAVQIPMSGQHFGQSFGGCKSALMTGPNGGALLDSSPSVPPLKRSLRHRRKEFLKEAAYRNTAGPYRGRP